MTNPPIPSLVDNKVSFPRPTFATNRISTAAPLPLPEKSYKIASGIQENCLVQVYVRYHPESSTLWACIHESRNQGSIQGVQWMILWDFMTKKDKLGLKFESVFYSSGLLNYTAIMREWLKEDARRDKKAQNTVEAGSGAQKADAEDR